VAPEPETKPKTEVGLDMTFFTGSPDPVTLTAVAPILRAIIPVGPFTLEPELPFVYYHYNVSVNVPGVITTSASDSKFLVGNPTFAFKYHARKKDLDVYVGAGVGLPLARVDQGETDRAIGYAMAFATRGAWNVWWYDPNALTFFVPAGVRYTAQSGFDLGAEVGSGILINTGSGTSDVVGAVQIGGHVGYAASFMEAGVRLKGVRLPGDGNADSFQASVEPYVRGLFEHAFIGAGFLINLDEPLGPLLDTGSFWGLRVEGGARF
jgi:hypothetical protein